MIYIAFFRIGDIMYVKATSSAADRAALWLRGGRNDVKIIIAGDGKVGTMLTKQLSAEGYDLTLIDANPQVLESTEERYDVMCIQ